MQQDEKKARIQELTQQIAALEAQLPRHSISPAMLQKLEALEDELQRLLSAEKDNHT